MRMGNLLRDFEIHSDTIRFPTGQAKGYYRSDFTDAWNRYCPEPKPAEWGSRTSRTSRHPQVSPEEASATGTAQAVPSTQAVPALTSENEAGTAGTAWVPELFPTFPRQRPHRLRLIRRDQLTAPPPLQGERR